MQDEAQLGRYLVQSGKLSEAELQEALARQKSLVMEGRAARLGEMLVKSGKVKSEDIQAALGAQQKKIGECDNCKARFNVVQWVPNRIYRCGKCQTGTLKPAEGPDVAVSGSHVMPAIGGAGASDTVKKPAMKHLGPIAIVKELGRGGMGVVYQGYQEQLRRTVAVKVLLSSDDEKLKARFLREARVVSRLRHPNIVGVHELGESDGKAWFTMDFIEGGPLNALFAPERIPAKDLLDTVRTIARALDYAHRQGLVHRDVKPQNILVAADGTPYLSDFGLAREVASSTRLTMSGAVMGTPSYMSPEQARGAGDQVDGRTDLYSLGAVLYEGLTGRAPFDGKDLIALLDAIGREEPRPPSQLVPGVPRDAETICLKALEKDPGKRYQSGEEMAQDIDRFLAGEPIQARRAGAIERGAKWVRRRAALAIGATAGAAVLVAALLIAQSGLGSDQDAIDRKLAEDRARVEEERRQEKEEYARKVKELEERLAAAKTEEDRARIAAEIKGLTGTGDTPGGTTASETPPPVRALEWERKYAEIRPLVDADCIGAARERLEAWKPVEAEDIEKQKEWRALISKKVEDGLARTRKLAAEHEPAGRLAEAAGAWKEVRSWGDAGATDEAEIEIARLEALILAREAKALQLTELPRLRASVADAMLARDAAGALSLIAACETSFPALASDAADLRWIVERGADFRTTLFGAFAKGVELDLPKYGDTGTTQPGRDDGKVVVKLAKMGAEMSIDPWKEIPPDRLVKIVRTAGGDEDAVAVFLWFHFSPKNDQPKELERAHEERAKNRALAREIAAKSQQGARLTAFFDALDADAAGPPAGPEDPPADPPHPAPGSVWAVEPHSEGDGVWSWSYDFNNPAQMADWCAGARDPFSGRDPWGARHDGGTQVWLRAATLGWTGSMMPVRRVTATLQAQERTSGRVGVCLSGIEAWIEDGLLSISGPDGKSLVGRIPVANAAAGSAVIFELEIQPLNFPQLFARVNGNDLHQSTIEGDPHGPTGVFCDGDASAVFDSVAIRSSRDDRYEDQLAGEAAFLAKAQLSPAAAKVLSDGTSIGRFTTRGGWTAAGGILRGKSLSSQPGGEVIMNQPAPRNSRVRFKYAPGTAREFVVDPRGGSGRIPFRLPMEQKAVWRDVEIVTAERISYCRVDGTLRIFPMEAARDTVTTGDLVFLVTGGDVAVDDVVIEELTGLAEGEGPSPAFQPPAPGGPQGPAPGGQDGWVDLFDRQTLRGFSKSGKPSLNGNEIVVTQELETEQQWSDAEFEIDFSAEQGARVVISVRGQSVAKTDLKPGKHVLYVRATGGDVEARLDDKPLKTSGGQEARQAPLRLKVDGGAIRIARLRHRGPLGPPGPGPGPDDGKGPKPR